ncbi:Speckle-type POZ protein A-like protein [Aphelenchoides bicaudatus]|nr:Speckle-type POZ protein A-like protein [Aphelenchoides bicaudatus]
MNKDFILTPELCFLWHLSREYKDEENLDAEVHVDENVFKASKFLLCIGSPVIKAAFAHNTERPNTLIIDNFEVKIVEQFLLFLHTGNLTLDYQNFDLLFPIADFFDVFPLRVVCVKSMHDNLNADNAMKYYAVADKFNVCGLKMNASKVFQKSITIKNFHDRYKFAISNGYAEFEEILG